MIRLGSCMLASSIAIVLVLFVRRKLEIRRAPLNASGITFVRPHKLAAARMGVRSGSM